MIVIIVTLFYSCTKKSFREIHHAEMAHITGRQRYRPAGLCCLQRPTGRAGAELSATRAQHCPVPKTGGSAGAGPKAAKPPITWAEARDKNGFRVDIECDHPGCSKPRAKPYPAYEGPVKKTDRRRQSDPYSTNQDPDYNIQLGYEW